MWGMTSVYISFSARRRRKHTNARSKPNNIVNNKKNNKSVDDIDDENLKIDRYLACIDRCLAELCTTNVDDGADDKEEEEEETADTVTTTTPTQVGDDDEEAAALSSEVMAKEGGEKEEEETKGPKPTTLIDNWLSFFGEERYISEDEALFEFDDAAAAANFDETMTNVGDETLRPQSHLTETTTTMDDGSQQIADAMILGDVVDGQNSTALQHEKTAATGIEGAKRGVGNLMEQRHRRVRASAVKRAIVRILGSESVSVYKL